MVAERLDRSPLGLLPILLYAVGIAAILVALLHLVLGPASIPGAMPVNATMDSEDRFYAIIFGGWGAALLWCTRDLHGRGFALRFLLWLFFLAGLARLVSMALVGPPHPFFIAMTALELILPPLLIWLHKRMLDRSPAARPRSGS